MNLHRKSLLLCLVLLASGCDVFTTTDAEGTRGRGAKAFDPYSSSASGAISLSLLYFNGCAILPNGEPVSRGSLNLPGYPDKCQRINDSLPLKDPAPPEAKMPIVAGSLYFLREFTAMDAVATRLSLPVDPAFFNDRRTQATWIRKQSRFKSLDWSGMTIGRDEWRSQGEAMFQRETFFENAAWMISDDDTFKLEVLDADGTVRASETYGRKDFLAENSVTGRTRASWTLYGLSRPEYPGDPVMHPSPDFGTPITHTGVKVSFANSTNPFKSFRMPQLTGEGVIRLTWSLMPEEPFVFPVTFVNEPDRQATCYKLDAAGLATEEQVPCGFGLEQTVRFQKPNNGKYFMPGETVDFQISLHDGDGNGLHPRDSLPSYNQYLASESNGIAYFNEWMITTFRDASSSEAGYKVVGPLDQLKVVNGTYSLPYFAYPETSEPKFIVEPGLLRVIAGYVDAQQPTRYSVKLPSDAKPGTYALLLKGHRSFMGERLNRLDSFMFQVGQEKPTSYPGRVGNCQICHNGVNSLVNLHHGMSVDHVESCKTCHFDETVGHISDMVHRLHMGSRKYAQNKADCTLCHLTRESTLRPSIMACNGCHVNAHGTEYFDLKFESLQNTPNAYGNCANACHVTTPPSRHVIPAQ
ncbi:hypothetical protein [Vitiosangium sp. GDMCC 1.1324]|uniref:hypothetical protein n=1 Tax=Vitiosangium sp. (strain GDMCC 1.1324) TaxID=2138576 RepID=UPI000D337BCA|nr:hypothetical protein [Vitiosangium sp. GDMCC 1.1324]PTL79248.1 hypothetical protein DAT35_34130 [Vitiosangium sp. GDMCC 1.1324]